MKTRNVAVVSTLLIALSLAACGDDDETMNPSDAGEAGEGGAGGSGGKGGSGGSGGAGGSAPAKTYSVGGTVSGLSGSGLKLKNNGGDELTVNNNGAYSFSTKLASGADYAVTVSAQPGSPMQTCSLAAASGKVGSSNVTNVNVTCSTNAHNVGGNVSGLGGGSIALKNNGGDLLALNADGSFMFATKVASGAPYAVTIETAPSGRTCSLEHATGDVSTGDVTDVSIACYANLTLLAQPRVGSVKLTWASNGATSYDARVSSNPNCDFDGDITTCADGAQKSNVSSGYIWDGLTNGKVYYFQVRGAHPASFTTRSDKPGVRPNRAQFDGPVNATAIGENGVAYAGGSFSNVGPFSGQAVPLDAITGLPTRMPNFPTVNGPVASIISDGTTGYYVGGSYTSIGGVPRNRLAHISADGTVDTTWDPDLDNGVSALALVGNTLYVSGSFTTVGATGRAGLAGVQTTGTGTATGWNPAPDGRVTTLATDGTILYVGGEFANISTAGRAHLAAYTESTGMLVASWHPDPDGNVSQILLDGSRLYVAGFYSNIASTMRFGLSAVNTSDGTLVSAFDPNPNMGVTAIAVSGTTLYAAGDFTMVNSASHPFLVALDTSNGDTVTGWDAAPDHAVNAIAVSSDTVYVGGDFTLIGGAMRSRLAALSATTGVANSFNPMPDNSVAHIFKFTDMVYVTGDFNVIGVEARNKLASFSNGALTSWAPDVKNGDVAALAYSSGTVYAGGDFTAIGTATRQGVAAIDGTGAATAWNAQLDNGGSVSAIALDSTHVFIGGSFGEAGGGARANLAGLNNTNGNVAAGWDPNSPDGTVRALAVGSDGTVYLGGEFLNVGNTGRTRLAAIDSSGNLVNMWAPAAPATVRALAVRGTTVYIGGEFTMLASTARNYLGAVGTNGTLDAWDPNLDGLVNSLSFAGSVLYLGGEFSQIGGNTGPGRGGVASFDTMSGNSNTPTDWQRNISGQVNAIAADANNVYIGGDFFRVNEGANQVNVSNFVKETTEVL